MGRAIVAILLTVLGACTAAVPGAISQASPLPAALRTGTPYEPHVDPARFVDTIDNPFLPLVPGTRWVYESEPGARREVDTVLVTSMTREILGVSCVVVRDEVSVDGELVELTLDWYAQDADGNVWYFGEDSRTYRAGEVVGTAGSWEAGVDGAQPGIVMPARPEIGVSYRQEYYPGQAEDLAKVVELERMAQVPLGSYDGVLVTEEWTPLEPNLLERKFYAPGVGLVMEETVKGGTDSLALVRFEPGD